LWEQTLCIFAAMLLRGYHGIGEEGGLNLYGMVGNCTLISFDILGLRELENPCKKEQEAAEELGATAKSCKNQAIAITPGAPGFP
jgi:hypothetical protein